jgi:uncharacterized membrane protein
MTDGLKDETQKRHPVRDYFRLFRLDTRSLAANAIVAAMYVALTYAFWFISYQPVQVRISEFLVLLVFFNPNYIYGLTIGCLLANLYSFTAASLSPLDLVFGTLATFLACFSMSLCRHMLVASFMPAIFNGGILAFEFTLTANMFPFQNPTGVSVLQSSIYYWTNFGLVFFGEIIAVSVLGYLLMYFLTKNMKGFLTIINAKRNLAYRF